MTARGRWLGTKRRLIGSPLASAEHESQSLPKVLALPVFASDALSSVAYATEEIALVLALAGAAALRFAVPISLGIAALMAIVVVSYRQTVRAYPDGGGAFIVANDNLGLQPAMVAAASLLTDYVLTVAVSVSAGMAAVTSAAPALLPYRVPLALGSVLLLTLANLRGVREASTLFAAPTYAFVVIVLVTLGTGFVRCLGDGCPQAISAGSELSPVVAGVSMFLVLRAFASGASALTGTEAIANGVQAFRPPKAHNAAVTLGMMGALAITMFLGISTQAHLFDVRVNEATLDEFGTVLSQIGRAVFGTGAGFIVLQAATTAILVLAANTAYQGFPRLSAILAAHRLMPRQYRNRGDRLAFSNGIITVSLLASVLIVTFGAEVSRLIQLYVVGVFTSFTLSQTGMVRHWLRTREKGWQHSVVINAVGAFATGVVLMVVAWAKFTHGAWIILVAVPFFVAGMAAIRRHYLWVASQLRQALPAPTAPARHRVVLLASRSGHYLERALRFARLLNPGLLEAWHVREPGDARLLARWKEAHPDVPLTVLADDGDGIPATLRRHLHRARTDDPDTTITVVVAERVGLRRWRYAFSHRMAPAILWALRREHGIAVVDLNYRPGARRRRRIGGEPMVVPVSRRVVWMSGTHLEVGGRQAPLQRLVAVVLVSEVTPPTLQAIRYAHTVCPDAAYALHVEVDPEQRARVEAAWADRRVDMPLRVLESPYRELTGTVVRYIQDLADRSPEGTFIDVVIPEFVLTTLAGNLLHNQSAFWIRLALYADTRVAVTSVPWVLERAPVATAG